MQNKSPKSNKRVFKLYVKSYTKGSGKSSIDALQYLRQNIDFLNNCQIHIKIIKIKDSEMDKDMVNELNSRGITKFPALVPDVGRIRLGVAKIKELVETNKRKINDEMKKQEDLMSREYEANYSDNPDLAKLWAGEMNFKSFKNDNGEESAFDGGANEDFGRKLAEIRRLRGSTNQQPDPLDEQPRRRRTDMNTEPFGQNGQNDRGGGSGGNNNRRNQNARVRGDNMPDDRPARNMSKTQEVPVVTKNQPMTDDMIEQRFMENSMLSDY